MMRKVGMAGSEANYLFVNIFKDFDQAANSNSIWDASVIGMNNSDIQTTSMREMIGLHYYQIEGAIQGAGKYSVHNYARPANLEGFVTENLKLWKPFFEKNMKAKKTKQTNWGIGTRIYPAGSESGATVFTETVMITLPMQWSHCGISLQAIRFTLQYLTNQRCQNMLLMDLPTG